MSIAIAQPQAFFVKNCTLASLATGQKVNSLLELRDKLATIDEGCLYYHFWGGRMNPYFVHSQFHNDFASWVYHRLHDQILAEKLSVIDPTAFASLEALRQELIETVESRLDDYEIVLWTRKEDAFQFISSVIIVFDSTTSIVHPSNLPRILENLPPGSIFYHFIDARARTPEKVDDFSLWLQTFDDQYKGLVEKIQAVDPYFLSLTELRDELIHVTQQFLGKEEKKA